MTIDTRTDLEAAPALAEPRVAAPAEGGVRKSVQQGILALADQSVLSGIRFLTYVIVGRACGPEELGLYALGFQLLVLFSCVQDALVFRPLVVYSGRLQGLAQREYHGGVLSIGTFLALAAGGCLAVLALLMPALGRTGLAPVLGMLALAGPAILGLEFCRWFSLAYRRLVQALVLDASVAVLQGGLVLALAAKGQLSATTAYLATAGVCATSAGYWFYRWRDSFIVRHTHVRETLKLHWAFARWVIASQAVNALLIPSLCWILAFLRDAEHVGRLAAYMMIFQLFNPLLLGINNFLCPRAAQALLHGGQAALRRSVWRTALVVLGGVALVAVPMALFGEKVIGLIYGTAYTGDGAAIALLSLAPLGSAWIVVFTGGLCAAERTGATFWASVAAVGASAAVAMAAVPFWGVAGAACGYLAAATAGAAMLIVFFQAATASSPGKLAAEGATSDRPLAAVEFVLEAAPPRKPR